MLYDPQFPLTEIFETDTHPNARTLRTSFSQKLWDAYNAMAGRPPLFQRNPHVGVFDYLTIYLATGLLYLLGWCLERAGRNFVATVLLIPVVIINIPLLILRLASAVVVILLFLPIIALVHGFSCLIAGDTYKEALNLEGVLKSGGKQTLQEYLTEEDMDIEELDITVKKLPQVMIPSETPQKAQFQLMFWRKATGPSSALECAGCVNGSCNDHRPSFSVEVSDKQATNIHALFKLNVGNVVGDVETSHLDDKDKASLLAL